MLDLASFVYFLKFKTDMICLPWEMYFHEVLRTCNQKQGGKERVPVKYPGGKKLIYQAYDLLKST